MANSHVELDFFGLRSQSQPQPQPQSRLDRRQSFRGISKINPEIVKSVIASASKHVAPGIPAKSLSLPGSPSPASSHPFSGPDSSEKEGEPGSMTIFYNGTVSVFDLPKDKAEYIMKLAMEKNISINSDGNIVNRSSVNSENSDVVFGPFNDGG
ncbi:protein TIFY 9 isoform X2 [Amaranthus tricolor]|uniref:protein TIFY 9 isoform X2 n=1 Tax=Amaranthus tricolor TaxID=29722 RepID=UPI00258398CA|nr:protein TIFY 9 isoform X2 [Amaranthus tricolor]